MTHPDSSTRIAELKTSCRRMAAEREAIAQLRQHVLRMRSEVDMDGLLEAIGEALTAVGIGYHNYGVNTVDTSTDPPSIQVSSRLAAGKWRTRTASSFLLKAWRKGQVLYRRDLHTEDAYDERRIRDRLDAPARAVIDVPFSHGTLAANSPEPSAFSDQDIAFLQDVAGVLSEGFLRWDDLQALEQRNRELSEQIDRREQVEKDLNREFELHRAASAIRVRVAEMQNPEDLLDVVEEIDRQLTHLDVGHLSASIQLVNPEGTGFVAVPLDRPRHLVSGDIQRWMASPPDPHSAEIADRQPWVVEAWRSGKTHYFRAIPDVLDFLAGGSLVDVPFSHGTVTINSPAPDAFSEDHIAMVQRLAGAVSASTQRYLDLLAQQRARERADHLALALRAIRNVNQLITREKDHTRLLEQGAHLFIETRGYDAAWIILLNDGGEIAESVSAGGDPAFREMARRAGTDDPPPCISRALEQPDTLTIHDPAAECGDCPLRGTDQHAGRLLARLEHAGAVYGLLCASLPSTFAADPEEQDLFRELVGDLAFALHDINAHQRLEREVAHREAEAAVRLRIAEMREPEDLVRVVGEISAQLSMLDIGHDDCSIQIVNADGTDFIHFTSKPAVKDHPFFSEGVSWSPVSDHAERFPWVFDVWRRQESRYDPSVTRVGTVRSGFSVKAEGNVMVGDSVEDGATIDTAGNVAVAHGIVGPRTKVSASGSVFAKFVNGARIRSGGDLVVSEYLNRVTAKVDNEILLSGRASNPRSGAIIAGLVLAGRRIAARCIGSESGETTSVVAGVDPSLLQEIARQKDLIERCEAVVNKILGILKLENTDPNEIRNVLVKVLMRATGKRRKTIAQAAKNLAALQARSQEAHAKKAELDARMEEIAAGARIEVSGPLAPRTVLRIGDQTMKIEEQTSSVTFALETEDGKPEIRMTAN